MASQPQTISASADASVSEHDWTSPLLPDHGDTPPSYVEPSRPPLAYRDKSTTLSIETKALAKSSVSLSGVHLWHTQIKFITGTVGLGLPASILDDTYLTGKPWPPTHPWRSMSNGKSSFSSVA